MVVEALRKDSWIAWRKPRTPYPSPDIFGLFDVVSQRKKETRYIQCKTNLGSKAMGQLKGSILSWCRENGPFQNGVVCQIANRKRDCHDIIYWWSAYFVDDVLIEKDCDICEVNKNAESHCSKIQLPDVQVPDVTLRIEQISVSTVQRSVLEETVSNGASISGK